MSALQRLAQELRDEGGLLATIVVESSAPEPHGDAVAPKGEDYPLLVEAIREGYLQHYASGRVVRPEDADLALLAGDRLYALGLERLAAIGDLDAVAELADVIALCAQAHGPLQAVRRLTTRPRNVNGGAPEAPVDPLFTPRAISFQPLA
jgi:hypothetical protein